MVNSHASEQQNPMIQSSQAKHVSTPRSIDLLHNLHACLADLDRLGESVAAAHLSACLDEFGKNVIAKSETSKMD